MGHAGGATLAKRLGGWNRAMGRAIFAVVRTHDSEHRQNAEKPQQQSAFNPWLNAATTNFNAHEMGGPVACTHGGMRAARHACGTCGCVKAWRCEDMKMLEDMGRWEGMAQEEVQVQHPMRASVCAACVRVCMNLSHTNMWYR